MLSSSFCHLLMLLSCPLFAHVVTQLLFPFTPKRKTRKEGIFVGDTTGNFGNFLQVPEQTRRSGRDKSFRWCLLPNLNFQNIPRLSLMPLLSPTNSPPRLSSVPSFDCHSPRPSFGRAFPCFARALERGMPLPPHHMFCRNSRCPLMPAPPHLPLSRRTSACICFNKNTNSTPSIFHPQ